ncbi:MAG: TIGR02281 family clan AA aspartic protease [Hyphomonadaceae bacterium]|nr:TIGR02281 family clan AA aspartic protease [Hyphomonadaceae bacterium]
MRAALVTLLLVMTASEAAAGSAVLDRDADGHWRAEGRVNGRKMELLVDTGATMVALTPDDAKAAGIDVRTLDFDARVRTASGTVRAALVTLERIQIGQVRVRDVEAMVIERGLPVSLLGMSFLNRLEQFQVRGQRLRLQD